MVSAGVSVETPPVCVIDVVASVPAVHANVPPVLRLIDGVVSEPPFRLYVPMLAAVAPMLIAGVKVATPAFCVIEVIASDPPVHAKVPPLLSVIGPALSDPPLRLYRPVLDAVAPMVIADVIDAVPPVWVRLVELSEPPVHENDPPVFRLIAAAVSDPPLRL